MIDAINPCLYYLDDDENDYILLKRAFKKYSLERVISWFRAPKDFIYKLRLLVECHLQLPRLVFLDINMPGINGFDVLKLIRDDPSFTHIPVIMMTTSNSSKDAVAAKKFGATDYLVKPDSLKGYYDLVEYANDFFLHSSRIPSN